MAGTPDGRGGSALMKFMNISDEKSDRRPAGFWTIFLDIGRTTN
jgi:hypothetical protein